MWRPAVRRCGFAGRETVPCGGRTVTVCAYGRGHSEKPQEGVSQHRKEEKGQEGRAREKDQSSDHRRGRGGGAGFQPAHCGQGVHRSGGSLRLRQVHHAADDRGPGGHLRRRAVHRRQADERRGAQGPGHRHGVPELRPVSPHDRVREHGLLPEAEKAAQGRDRPAGSSGGRDPGHHPVSGPQAQGPVRRPAAACGHRPRHRPQPRRVPDA